MGVRFSHRQAVLRLSVPPLAALLLLVAAMLWWVLPTAQEALLEQKRETLRAIVASAISLCERHHAEELAGRIDRQTAQQRAATDLRALRYGDAHKDYLWVIDQVPRMVAHPYRPDLEGLSLGDLRDPDGVALFAESLRMVRAQGEGFLRYRWQWHDEPERIEPKLSHVRGFSPWGWVIGSGVYLNDVEEGVARSTRQVLMISGGLALLLAALLVTALRQGLVSEALREAAEEELRHSRARYQALAQGAEEAVWLVREGRVAGANRSACALFGCDEQELVGREAAGLFVADTPEPPLDQPHEALLETPAGAVPVWLAVSSAQILGQPARVVTARNLMRAEVSGEGERRLREAAEAMLSDLAVPHLGWLQAALPLGVRAPGLPLECAQETAAGALANAAAPAVLLKAADGGVAGMLTARGLLRHSGGRAYQAMHSPVPALPAEASLVEAAEGLAASGGVPLLVGSECVLDAEGVLQALRQHPVCLEREVGRASQELLPELRQRILLWLRMLVALQVQPERIAREATRLADAVLKRCLVLCLDEMGPAPAPFELIVLGSQGRHEMMPGSDQDNALIYAEGADAGWFRELAGRLVARYAAAGWPRCQGGTTCANERWCLSLPAWRAQFSEWIAGASPRDLMEVATFFDLRALGGEAAMTTALRAHALQAVAEREVFLHQLGQAVLDFRPPQAVSGRHPEWDEAGLKGCLMHFASFARLEALRHGVGAQGTGERLRLLAQAGALPPALVSESLSAWQYLLGLRLRLRTQPALEPGEAAPEPGAWDQALVKRALGQVGVLQARLRQAQEGRG